jgi:hypothetical protein
MSGPLHAVSNANQETIAGVVIGAVLATLGGFLASQLEHHIRRRERERSAALLFGEILFSLRLILRIADQSRLRGDPYGSLTLRMIKGAQGEVEIYARNREALFDLRNAALRAEMHVLFVQMAMTLDGVVEAITSAPSGDAEADLAVRAASFDFAVLLCEDIGPLIERLGKTAKYSFEAHEALGRKDYLAAPAQA